MNFNQLCQQLETIEATDSRLAMTQQLAQLLPQLTDEEIKPTLYLIQGRLMPQYRSLEFNLSEKMILRLLAKLLAKYQSVEIIDQSQANLFAQTDETSLVSWVKQEYGRVGDLGLLTKQIMAKLHLAPQSLSITAVYQSLIEIAQDSGAGSQDRKLLKLLALLEKISPSAAKYTVRVVLGKMRLGFGLMTLLDTLSWAKVGDKTQTKLLETYYQRQADIGKLAQVYLRGGLVALQTAYDVQVGVPVVPELCQRLNTAEEIIEKMGSVVAEPKYDGLRAQIHFDAEKQLAQVYSRSLEDISAMFPEVKMIGQFIQFKSCIFDAEAVGINPQTGEIVPFQETMKRKRKYNIASMAQQIPIRFYVFDILDVDDRPLIDLPLLERKTFLAQAFPVNPVLVKTPHHLFDDAQKLHQFHQQMLADGYEGVVVKHPQAPYRAGRKGWRWVKIKEAEGTSGKLHDTLDLVVMGYYFGRGKRAQFGLGAILVGIMGYNEEILSIAKIGTGMSEDQLKILKQKLDQLKTSQKPKVYHSVNKLLQPDVWVEPKLVVEIAADEITHSPVHAAGVALRFPRLIRLRIDKSWEDATSINELGELE